MYQALKLLIISAVIPVEGSGGGCLAMKRHFVDRNDFEIAVASQRNLTKLDCPTFEISRSRFAERLRKTRLCRIIENKSLLLNWSFLPKDICEFTKQFEPDVIFSVVDDRHMGWAWQLSQKFKIPLAVDFQDLFALSSFVPMHHRPFLPVRRFLINKYKMLNGNAAAVFHTSEGMKKWFHPDPRGEVLYPIGDSISIAREPAGLSSDVIKLVYAGNCYGAYGRMLLELAKAASQDGSRVKLTIFSQGNDWPDSEIERYTKNGIYRGSLPFADLKLELEKADAFLTVMSFEDAERIFVRTSFTTKWLDYAPFGKPIFVWGPAYSTASVFAKEYHAGFSIVDESPNSVIETILQRAQRPADWEQLGIGALNVATGLLNSTQIHERLRQHLEKLKS